MLLESQEHQALVDSQEILDHQEQLVHRLVVKSMCTIHSIMDGGNDL